MLCNKNDKSIVTTTFKYNEEELRDPASIAGHFCDFFTNVGPQYAEKIPRATKSYEYYLTENRTPNPKSLFLSPTDHVEIASIIKLLKPKKSTGHDNVSLHFLKQINKDVAEPISILVNKSICEGVVPDSLKIAKVIPIYKNKDKSDFANYRPISLLTSLSKILEKVVHKRTYAFLNSTNIFHASQYGFRSGRSTVNAITEFMKNVLTSLENKESVISVFLDLSKAFDTINHDILLKKLERYGIRGQPLNWFRSYLSNRQQYVHYGNSNSDKQTLVCGVPQGSVLGPLLFIIYTNDLSASLMKTKSILFADDTTIYASNKDLSKLYADVNADLVYLNDWFMANKLSLNVGKTNYLLISNISCVTTSVPILRIGTSDIERKPFVKFLGVYIDENLTWHEHIKVCKSKLISALYAINKVKVLLPVRVLKTLYYSLVYPHLTYGILLWGSTYTTHISKIVIMQKKIVRAISNVGYNANSHPLFVSLEIFKLNDIYMLEIAKFMHRYVNNNLPPALSNLFTHTSNIHAHETRQSNYIRPVTCRLNVTFNSVLSKGPKIWNSISSTLQCIPLLKQFVNSVKTFIKEQHVV
jgi:hypothetical protein